MINTSFQLAGPGGGGGEDESSSDGPMAILNKLGLSATDQRWYTEQWSSRAALIVNNFLPAKVAPAVFGGCGLPKQSLKVIWDLSDITPPKWRLNEAEFYTALKYIATEQAGIKPSATTALTVETPLPVLVQKKMAVQKATVEEVKPGDSASDDKSNDYDMCEAAANPAGEKVPLPQLAKNRCVVAADELAKVAEVGCSGDESSANPIFDVGETPTVGLAATLAAARVSLI